MHWLAYASWPVAVSPWARHRQRFEGVVDARADRRRAWPPSDGAVRRIARGDRRRPSGAGPAIALAVVAPLGLAVFTARGPASARLGERAGTPASLLAPLVRRRDREPVVDGASAAGHCAAPVLGRRSRERSRKPASPAARSSTWRSTQRRGARDAARAACGGAPTGGGLSMTGSQVDLTADGLSLGDGGPDRLAQRPQFVARVKRSAGAQLDSAGQPQHRQPGRHGHRIAAWRGGRDALARRPSRAAAAARRA